MKSLKIPIFITCIIYSILGIRAIWLHITPESTLSSLAKRQYAARIELAPYRGSIFDRKKNPLAISIRSPSIAMNPKRFRRSKENIHRLAKALNISTKKIQKISKKDKYFAWLQRKVSHTTASKIKAFKIPGIFEIVEPSRFYPNHGIASHLIGYVGIDNVGLLGLESSYEQHLRGEPMKIMRARDARGKPIFLSSAFATPEVPGHDIHLTIDQVIQEIAQTALKKGVEAAKAQNGFAIVMDPHTGNILALANEPSFDPNNWRHIDWSTTRNHALSDLYEPGSVIKPIVLAQALEQQKVTIDETIPCFNGRLNLERGRIHDDHAYEELPAADVLVYSSNIGIYQIAKRLGDRGLNTGLHAFGLAGNATLNLPEESKGRTIGLPWSDLKLANISFGQGLSTVGLEVTAAYSILANGGRYVSPRLVQAIESSQDGLTQTLPPSLHTTVISPHTALQVRKALHQVVVRGTGKRAQPLSYEAAGKTGTSEKFDMKTMQYSKHRRIASFAGFAPALDPHIVVYVVIDEPTKKPYYGGVWAAPVFSEIVEHSLHYLNVAPHRDSHS